MVGASRKSGHENAGGQNSESPISTLRLHSPRRHGWPPHDSEERPKAAKVSILRNLAEVRGELYYLFGLLCLGSWFVFNLWILRDYFFPWWFAPIYTETGLRKRKLELKKREYVMRSRMSNAFNISTTIAMPQYPQDCISLPMDAPREPRKTSSVDGVLFG
ncbi:hypothetical protein QR680_005002 [Steinernema hermaphroditum]|uniref:Uncharacterized protein n=1 Tax=Steinernema hermaphroditum TaxID=289476 RepID=A0AA39LUK8_9BILA|nr:hypothetical protein QR680_005002 [Steinernema hermaphroditum]